MNSRVPVTVLERPSTPTGNSQRPLTTQHTGGKLKYHLKLSSTAYVAQAPLSNTSQAPLTHIHTYIHTYILRLQCSTHRRQSQVPLKTLKYRLRCPSTSYNSQIPLKRLLHTYIHTYSGCNAQRTGGHLKHRLKLSSTTYVAQVPLTLLKYQMQLSNASQAPLTYIHTYIHTYIRTYIHTYIHAHIHTYVSQSWSTQHAIPQSSNSYRQLPSANSNSQAPHTTLSLTYYPKHKLLLLSTGINSSACGNLDLNIY